MSNETPLKTRGRPAGSNSFTRMRLSDLATLMGANAVVPVSKVWLRENGINTEETLKPVSLPVVAAPATEEPKIEFALTTFDDEDGKKNVDNLPES